jgi:hypothetical protein
LPGYLQSRIIEDLRKTSSPPESKLLTPHMQSRGQMFGLTFWENWYVMSERRSDGSYSNDPSKNVGLDFPIARAIAAATNDEKLPEMKLVFYTGHTLQGSYKGGYATPF